MEAMMTEYEQVPGRVPGITWPKELHLSPYTACPYCHSRAGDHRKDCIDTRMPLPAMPEASRLTPVDGLQDLREALRDGENIMVNGKPWRDVFCEMYDYAEGLERELRQKAKEIERLREQLRAYRGAERIA